MATNKQTNLVWSVYLAAATCKGKCEGNVNYSRHFILLNAKVNAKDANFSRQRALGSEMMRVV